MKRFGMATPFVVFLLIACGQEPLSTPESSPPDEDIQILPKDIQKETTHKPQSDDATGDIQASSATDELRRPDNVLSETSTQPVPGRVNRVLYSFYSQQANYNKVYNNVMGWYGSTSNGCVAFMSTALRMSGVSIPQGGYLGGEPVSLVTLPFSRYLSETLGWNKITSANDLLPGDVVFTIDAPGWPGYPAHTYMFHSWVDKSRGIGRVIDNQAFTHNRNIFGYGDYNFSPFKYALRAPN